MKKKYLLVYASAIYNGYRLFSTLTKLKDEDKEHIKNGTAILFSIVDDEIVRINMNGSKKVITPKPKKKAA